MKLIFKKSMLDEIVEALHKTEGDISKRVEKIELTPEEYAVLEAEFRSFSWNWHIDHDLPESFKKMAVKGYPVIKAGLSYDDLKVEVCRFAGLPDDAAKGVDLGHLVIHATKSRYQFSAAGIARALSRFIEERFGRA